MLSDITVQSQELLLIGLQISAKKKDVLQPDTK